MDPQSLAQGTIRVELVDVEGSAAREGCAIGLVGAAPREVFEVINDAEKFEEFMPRVVESEVEPADDGTYLNTQRLELPFPLKDRRYTIRVTSSVDGEGANRVFQVGWTYVEGSGNVKENYGSWTLAGYPGGQTLVTYRLFSDPGGVIPKWALNRATSHTLPRVIQALRRRISQLRARSPR